MLEDIHCQNVKMLAVFLPVSSFLCIICLEEIERDNFSYKSIFFGAGVAVQKAASDAEKFESRIGSNACIGMHLSNRSLC